MTNAYAIKGPDGNIDLVLIDTDIEETWYEYIKSVEGRVPTSGSIVKDIQYWKDEGFTCVPVTVSEKGEAEALLKKLVDRLHAVHADPLYHSVWALHQIRNGAYTGPQYAKEVAECDAYLARKEQ